MSDVRAPLDRSAAATGLVVVLAANLLYLTGLPLILDPTNSEDAFYIHMAQRPIVSILREDPAWGPLYAVWLKPLSAALHDPVMVYLENLCDLSVGVSVLIYLYLLLLTRQAAVGVAAALFFLICDLNVPLSSKVSSFAAMVVLAGLAVSELVPAGARRLTVAGAGTLLSSYARPELYPAALGLCLAAFWVGRREAAAAGVKVLRWPAACLLATLLLAASIGPPLWAPDRGSGRLLMAFREHFAWNWSRWHNRPGYFLAIWDREFGGAQTLLQALRNNPGAVAHHLSDNLLGTVRFMVTSAFDHYPLVAPSLRPALVKAESLLVSTAVFGSLILVACRPRLRREMLDRYGYALFVYLTLGLCSLTSAIVVFPVAPYLVLPALLVMLTGALAATVIVPPCPDVSWRTRILAALVCLAAVPKPFALPSAYAVSGSPFKGQITVVRKVADTIGFIRSLNLPAPVQVLTVTDGIGALLGSGFNEVKMWQKGAQPLEAFMREHDIGLIVNLEAGRDSFVVDDPYWAQLQINPAGAGFVRVTVPNHEAVGVYVRKDLMPAVDPTHP
jgi:hypothetical protein